MKDFAKSIVCNTKVGNVGERGYSIVGIKSNPAKYKMGQSVKVNGEKGKITQIQAMKMSSTPTYKIKLDSGKEVWAYEEEIGNSKVGNIKPGDTGYVWRGIPREKYKVKILKVDGGWARFVFINGEFKGQEDEELISQIKTGNSKVGNGLDQQEAREFQQSLKPIKSLIEDAGAAAYASPKEALAKLQRAKQEIEKAIQWLK